MKVSIKELHFTPTFRGKHNETRSKCWLVLLDCELSGLPGLTLAELTHKTGCNYKSLSVLLKRWVNWHYIGCNSRPGGRQYHLLKRGRAWLDRWASTSKCPQCGGLILTELIVFGSYEWKRHYCLICSREFNSRGHRVVSEARRVEALALHGDRTYHPGRWRTSRPDFITLCQRLGIRVHLR